MSSARASGCLSSYISPPRCRLVVAITDIGVATGRMRGDNAAALVGAGMLSLLLFRCWPSYCASAPAQRALDE